MPNKTSPKPSFHARKEVHEEEQSANKRPQYERPTRSPEVQAEIERFYETGCGGQDKSRPCHLI